MNKIKFSAFFLCAVFFLGACSDEESFDTQTKDAEASLSSNSELALTRATVNAEDSVEPLAMTDSMRMLKETAMRLAQIRRASTNRSDYVDENFSSNIYAIREMPLTIEVRESGKDKSKKYFYCNGKNSEVKLTNTKKTTDRNQQFYVRILPATSGIPYLLYSQSSKTPLTVGHYKKTPKVNILMSSDKDDISNPFVSWNLFPTTYQGYFSIENEMLLGQSDPNNSWSVFNYSLEVNDNDEIRFAKYSNKGQQQFLISPVESFKIDSVVFDLDNAKITDGTPVPFKIDKVVSRSDKEFSQEITRTIQEKSWFRQSKNNIKFNMSTVMNTLMPTVLARRAVLVDGEPKITNYSTSTYLYVSCPRHFTVSGLIPNNKEKCLLQISMNLTAFDVEINYTVYAKCNNRSYSDRKIKFTGVWHGYIVPDPTLVDPEIITRFFDCTTGEEFSNPSAAKSFKVRK